MTAVTPQAIPDHEVQAEALPSTEDLAIRLFCLIDDLYRDLVPDAVQARRGHHT